MATGITNRFANGGLIGSDNDPTTGVKVTSFTSSGNFTQSPTNSGQEVDYLIIAGGGGGGPGRGGGGGAGGYKTSFPGGTKIGSVPFDAVSITVGAGGAEANNGSNSVALGVTSTGGGQGGAFQTNGTAGGSGGGGGSDDHGGGSVVRPGGAASPSGQGNAGGNSYTQITAGGCGGGGGAVGD